MSEEGRWMLPSGWAWARAAEFSRVVGGGTPKNAKQADNYSTHGVPWITPADLSGYEAAHISRGGRDLSEKGFKSCSARMLPKGTVLLSSRAPVGYCVVAANDVCTNQGFKSFVLASNELVPEFIRYYLIGSRQYLESESSGTTFLELSASRAEQLQFPIAPAREQARIVSKIDELFSQIEEGERALERAQKLVEQYRQSVLKAAVTGELTREWRERRKGRLEAGDTLLARILETRRAAWEKAELDKMKGIKPANDKWKQKYRAPLQPETTDLPELPEGWVWASLGALITRGPQNGLYLHKDNYGLGVPIVRIDDYQPGWSRPVSELRRVSASEEDRQKYRLAIGDFVLNRVNSVSHLGKCMVAATEHTECLFESNMMRFGVSEHIDKVYLEFYLRGEFGRKLLIKNCKHAVNQASINQDDVANTPVPLPSLEEQSAICEFVARELSKAGTECLDTEKIEQRSRVLRQAVLRVAFSGALVAQNPADEPATLLLERISDERSRAIVAAERGARTKDQAA